MPFGYDTIWKAIQDRWNLAAGSAAWLGSLIGGFLLPPPAGATQSADNTTLVKFGQFFLTLAVVLIAIPMQRWRQRRHMIGWLLAAVALFVLAPVVYFQYQKWTTAWTCPYAGSTLVVGSELTEHGKSHTAKNPDQTCEQLVWDHAGNVEEVWTKDSIEARRFILAVSYVLGLPLLAGAVVCGIQAGYCASRRR